MAPAHARLWREAAAIHQLKLGFVDALQRFTRAQAGTFGDEGVALRASVGAMAESLSRWDDAVARFESEAARLAAAAEVHVAVATVLLDRHRIDDALRALQSAARLDDRRPDVPALEGLALAAAGKPADAARAFRRATDRNPDNPVNFYARAQQLARAGDAGAVRALREFHGVVSRQTAAAKLPFERLDLLRQAPRIAPIFPHARYVEAFDALRSGDYAAAVASFDNASRGDPLVAGEEAARQRLAGAAVLMREGRFGTALSMLQAAVDEAPDHADTHRLLGLLYSLDNQIGKSIESLRMAIRLAPDDERARVLLADILADDRRLSEAERELLEALGRGVRSGQALYRLAQLYERQALLPQAARAFLDSETPGPIVGRDEFYRALGSLLVNQADFEGAVAAYQRRIEVNPNSGEAHRQLGEIYFLQGRDDEALAEFLAAVWLDPSDARAHAGAGQVHARAARYGDAIGSLRRALSLDEGLREARYALGTSLMRLRRAAEAKRELDIFARQQAEAEAAGQLAFQLDALRRDASRSLLASEMEQAIARFEEALRLDPGARSRRDLGLALLRAKRAHEAIDQLSTAQALEETPEGFLQLAEAFAAAGDGDEAGRQRERYRLRLQRDALERVRALAR